MVRVGQEMRNERAGERFVWRATRESTNGAYCEFDLFLDGAAKVAAAHRHPHQEERFTVVTGQVALTADGDTSSLGPHEVGVVDAGVPHSWRNTTGAPSHVVVRLTPALHIEDYFEKYCAIATAGDAGPTGLPRNPLQLAALLDAYREEFAFATPMQQRLLSTPLAVLAVIGRRLGFGSRCEEPADRAAP